MELSSQSMTEIKTASMPQFTTGQVISIDGTRIGYRQVGRGPGLVIMHGGVRASQHYLRLAGALADQFTVTIPDRRGRGLSGPAGSAYSLAKELDDLSVVLQKTQSKFLFGHSAGGFFALEAALHLPIQRLVVYEPAVSIHGSMPLEWVPAYERAVAANDMVHAMVRLYKGLRLNWMSRLPDWLLAPFARMLTSGEEGREMAELLPTGVWEIKELQRLEQLGQTFERYACIRAKTLVIGGAKSPAYLRDAARTVAATIPNGHLVELPDQNHNAPDQNAPEMVADLVQKFINYQ